MLVSIRAVGGGVVARLPRLAPVAQWIECRPPEPEAQVRVLPGAHRASTRLLPVRCRDDAGPVGRSRASGPGSRRLDPDPLAQCRAWLAEAETAGVVLANAIALATAGADGAPTVRHVLLRKITHDGFTFFTNLESRKGPRSVRERARGVHRLLAGARPADLGPRRGRAARRRPVRRVLRDAPARRAARRVGERARADRSRTARRWSDVSRSRAAGSPTATSPGRRTGVGTCSSPTRSSAGRAGRSGCTTASATRARAPAGASTGCTRNRPRAAR